MLNGGELESCSMEELIQLRDKMHCHAFVHRLCYDIMHGSGAQIELGKRTVYLQKLQDIDDFVTQLSEAIQVNTGAALTC